MKKLSGFLDTEAVAPEYKVLLRNIKDTHDFSVGTPPVKSCHIDFISQVQLGGQVSELRKYRDVIGVTGDINEGHWNYLMDTLEQMISQSTHYTTKAEVADFLNRTRWAVNFKGLNGMIRTDVSSVTLWNRPQSPAGSAKETIFLRNRDSHACVSPLQQK